jgi:uncharacterized protein (TIGR00255 family)
MMKSMTGFGRADAAGEGTTWVVEVSSVNRKQLEVVVNLPRELAELESTVRSAVSATASRGRVNVSVRCSMSATTSASELRIDKALAKQYASALATLASELGLLPTLSVTEAMRWPGVLEVDRATVEAEAAWPLIEQALKPALAQFLAMREAEGLHLHKDVQSRLAKLAELLAAIEAKAPLVPVGLHKAMLQRLQDAGLPVDLNDERLLKELAVFADRCDISEEITRAKSHFAQFTSYLASDEALGRSMDFLTQELFREFNTIGSKANNAELAHLVVAAKSEIEKIREQVQNVE